MKLSMGAHRWGAPEDIRLRRLHQGSQPPGKLDDRSKPDVFVGYAKGTKAYRIHDLVC